MPAIGQFLLIGDATYPVLLSHHVVLRQLH